MAPVVAVVVVALGLYASRGVLDQVVTPSGLVRVALLPPWQMLGGFLAIGLLGWLWLDRRAVPRGTATAVRPPLAPLLAPVAALGLLVVPYLPVLPDMMPALQALAGPAGALVWVVVATQLLWVLWQARLVRFDSLRTLGVGQAAVLVALSTAAVSGGAALRLAGGGLYPGGDEPHYLVIAQSLWRDGDLAIENNHTRGDYYEYFPRELAPHYVTRGVDQQIYSIHPVGMPIVMAPVYAVGGYAGVVFGMVLLAAVAAGLAWRVIVSIARDVGAATFGWAAVVLTAPFLFNAFAVYPEIPAALAVALALDAWVRPDKRSLHWLTLGISASVLPWLSTKYAPMSAAIVAVALLRLLVPPDAARAAAPVHATSANPVTAALLVLVPYGLSLLAWFAFFAAHWGTPWPHGPYGSLVQTDVRNLLFGAPGLLFDQEYGLLPYAPVYVLAATGLAAMWRDSAINRRHAIEIIVVFLALLGTVGAFRIWWGGTAAPGRPLTSGLLLLGAPIAFAFRASLAGSARRAAQQLLLWVSVGVSGVLLFAQDGFLTANGRDGTSSLLEYLSPFWPAWTMVPSFIHHEAPTALAHTALWLLLAAAAATWVTRARTSSAGAASRTAVGTAVVAMLVAVVVMPRLPLQPPWPDLNVKARGHLALIDRYDTTMRPVGVRYEPLSLVAPASQLPVAVLEVAPGTRLEPPPLRVMHNGRFSLPPGTYRLEVAWTGSRSGEHIGLQIGRTGPPMATWPVTPEAGGVWTHEFSLPLHATFVGVHGSPELERVTGTIRLVTMRVSNQMDRPRAGEVVGATRSGASAVYFFDEQVFAEADGFWIRRGRRARVAVPGPAGGGTLTLRVHGGPVANALTVKARGWSERTVLVPGKTSQIDIPVNDPLVMLELTAEAGFVPSEIDSQSKDPRPLGVWVEVMP